MLPAIIAALPWLLAPLAIVLRMRGAPSLDDEPPEPPAAPPLASVIVPARNEARSIERCAASVLATAWPRLELVIVNDRSEDATGAIARALAARDPRVRVVDAAPLPPGWFGKQWACDAGARLARGEILQFTDADTVHAPDLVPRAVHAMRSRRLDFLTVAGHQELGSFWERVVQPQMFFMITARYGGPRTVNRSRRVEDKIANGQCMFFTADAYRAVGGHAAVRAKVAEDLALAQLVFVRGLRSEVVMGERQLSTRMYASLGEIVRGWMKNTFAAPLDAVPFGRVGRALLPAMLLVIPVLTLLPVVTLLLAPIVPLPTAVAAWAALATAGMLAWWGLIYRRVAGCSPLYALTVPLGAAVVAYILVRAIARGRRVEWKGRVYDAG